MAEKNIYKLISREEFTTKWNKRRNNFIEPIVVMNQDLKG